LLAHAIAQQAFILTELGEVEAAVTQLAEARTVVKRSAPRLLRAWLAAAHGEGLATAGRRDEALRAFEAADMLLPADPVDPTLPFLFLQNGHLDRWRGHALATLGDVAASSVLTCALERLDPTFTRAEASLQVDLAMILTAMGEQDDAHVHAKRAEILATDIGSIRQRRRIRKLTEKR
jgi:tetratricopeptide (TPR) repeat protein